METIGYLGPEGTFTEEAVLTFINDKPLKPVPCRDIGALILAVSEGSLDMGVVPVENALEGTVNITVDMLVHTVDLRIAGEIVLPIRHCLAAPPGVRLSDVKGVLSHPQALAQCRAFLHRTLRGVEEVVSSSTAAGAQEAAERGGFWAAIATQRAAGVYGLEVLKTDIQDHQDNSTRFILLSRQEVPATGRDKTSVAFTVDDTSGSLLQALTLFADHRINLKKIESRPMRTILGQYLFLVDFEGHRDDPKIGHVLQMLRKKSKFYKLLGSYPQSPGLAEGPQRF